MSRRLLAPVTDTCERLAAVAYQVWLSPDQIEMVKAAQLSSALSWPEWTEEAVARISREDDAEIKSLLKQWNPDREGKKLLSFRLYPGTLTKAKVIAKKHDRTVQALFAHAHFMQAFAMVPGIPSRVAK